MDDHRECSIDGCHKKVYRRQWCSAHYSRQKIYGDPLFPMKRSASGSILAFVEKAKLYTGNECLFFEPVAAKRRRIVVRISGKNIFAHIVVCEHVHGKKHADKPQVAHSCGNGHLGCLTPKHLRWDNHTNNQKDRVIHQTDNSGERNGRAKIKKQDVIEIRKLEGTLSSPKISKIYGISESTVRSIIKRRTWAHVC